MRTKRLDEAAGLDDLDPATTPARDAKYFRAIVGAAEATGDDEDALGARVSKARTAGDSWAAIAGALGVTEQPARVRFSLD